MDVGTILLDQSCTEVYQHNKRIIVVLIRYSTKKMVNTILSLQTKPPVKIKELWERHISSLLVLKKSSQITVSIFYSEDYENKFQGLHKGKGPLSLCENQFLDILQIK